VYIKGDGSKQELYKEGTSLTKDKISVQIDNLQVMDQNIQDALMKFEVKKEGAKTKHFHAVVKVIKQTGIKFEMTVDQGMAIKY